MRGQLYHGHANATALFSSPVVSALGSELNDPGSSPGWCKALCPWDVWEKKKCPQDPNFLGHIYDGKKGRISRVQKESSSLMPQILQLNIEKVWNSKLTLELTCSFCNLLTNAPFKCYLLSWKFTWVMTKLKPWQQCTLSYTRKTLLFMFPNCHVNFHSCYFMTRKLTPGIQEVNSQPVYLPDGMVQMVHSFSGSAARWVCTCCGSNLVLNFSN